MKYIYILFYRSYIEHIEGVFGTTLDLTTLIFFKDFWNSIGLSNFGDNKLQTDFRQNFLLNFSLLDFENLSLAILFGADPRLELPLLSLRLRKFFLQDL